MPGSIRARKPGVWQIRVSAGRDLITGRYRTVTETVYGTEAQAKRAAARLQTRVSEGQQAVSAATLSTLLEAWIDALEKRGRAPKTVLEYRHLGKVISDSLGKFRLRKLTVTQIEAFYGGLRARGLAPGTVRHYHATLCAALRQAVRWGWLDRSPMERVEPPSVDYEEPAAPTVDEVQRLIAAADAKNPSLASFLFVAATTGCRRGELCGLQWGDLQLDEPAHIVVRRSISSLPGRLEVRSTKTGRVRRLALDVATVGVFRRQCELAEERCRALGTVLAKDAYVWSQEADHSRPWSPDRVTDAFRNLRGRLDLPHLRLHHFRHFAATIMLAGGVDVRTAAGRLGHSQPAITLRTYAHVLDAPDRVAADLLGSLVGGGRNT